MATGYSFTFDGSGLKEGGAGICVPRYAPGFDIEMSNGDGNGDACTLASARCVVTYKAGIFKRKELKKILSKEFNDMTEQEKASALKKRKEYCTNNCECLKANWEDEINNMCVAMGDCGEKNNFIGRSGKKIGVVVVPPSES
jgi:hypothetical protein